MNYQKFLNGEPVRVIGQSTIMDVVKWDSESDVYLCEFPDPGLFGDDTIMEFFESRVLEEVKFTEVYKHIFCLTLREIELLQHLYHQSDSNRIEVDPMLLNDDQSYQLESLFQRLNDRNHSEFGEKKHGTFVKEFIEFDFLNSNLYFLYKDRIRNILNYYGVQVE